MLGGWLPQPGSAWPERFSSLRRRGDRQDFPPHSRPLRRLLAKRSTHNVVCELGDPEADRTVVFVSHHDAAHAGLIFHPGIPKLVAKTGLFTKVDTSPMLMAPVIGGPVLAVAAAATGSKRLAEAGGGAFGRLARHGRHRPAQVPGANDNGTAVVALLELARAFPRRTA
jgi:hypothetical protein